MMDLKEWNTKLHGALAACREHLVTVGILSALINCLYLTPSLYMLQVYDRVIPTGGRLTLLWITLVAALALLVLTVLDGLRMRVLVKGGLRFERVLAPELLRKSMGGKEQSGLAAKAGPQLMRQFDLLRGTVCGSPALAFFDLPWTPIYIVVATLVHPLLGVVLLISAAALVAMTYANNKATKAKVDKAALASQRAYALNERFFRGRAIIRALGMTQPIVGHQLLSRSTPVLLSAEAQLTSATYNAAGKYLRLVMQSLALAIGALLAIDRQISPGAIIAVSILLTRALQPVEQLLSVMTTLENARQAYRDITDALNDEVDTSRGRTTLPVPTGHIALENVYVRGSAEDEYILSAINLTFVPGRIVGVVGHSGAGKTTLARLLSFSDSVDTGKVRIDGADLRDWDGDHLGRHVGYLPQDVALFPGTIAENIRRFETVASNDNARIDSLVIEAAKLAGAHDMIMGLRGTYDRHIMEGGIGISTGQQQLIGLARALYRSPRILVLDEPNSALDGEGEARLVRAIHAARAGGATVIIVAHRLGLISHADDIVVLRQGRVQEFGPATSILPKLAGENKSTTASPLARSH